MQKKIYIILPLFLAGLLSAQKTQTPQKVSATTVNASTFTEDQKASYYFGLNIAKSMKADNLNIDVDLLAKAMKEEFAGSPKTLPEAEMQSFLQSYSQKIQEQKKAAQQKIAEDNKKKSADFLANNKTKSNVKTTASGLQYEVLKKGDGTTHPTPADMVSVTYTGKLLDGTVFDSTDKNGGNPLDISLGSVIKGWAEGIQLMNKGDQFRFYIPADLAYGDRGAGNIIPPGSALIFDVELKDIKSNAPAATPTK